MRSIQMLFAAGLLVASSAEAADPKPVQLEPIPGTGTKRITLTPKAAERLGIETALVREQSLARRQMVSGLVVDAVQAAPPAPKVTAGFTGFTQTAGSFAPGPAPVAKSAPPKIKPKDGTLLVAVALSSGEWERLDKAKPARLLPLQTRDAPKQPVIAPPSGLAPVEDAKRSMLTVHYTLSVKDASVAPERRMRVELPIAGGVDKQKVVPYGAVYYDAKGSSWVYINSKPLVFERQRIAVERVVGDVAVLADGPAVGTQVVSVGAALLYGTEIFGK
jgi:hypothetical protein